MHAQPPTSGQPNFRPTFLGKDMPLKDAKTALETMGVPKSRASINFGTQMHERKEPFSKKEFVLPHAEQAILSAQQAKAEFELNKPKLQTLPLSFKEALNATSFAFTSIPKK
eukprot:CAMPEP_0168612924 /NCGR_PEP_ID=MMETSP0449_2-20121227/3176_1 /TAXON_ID=1082188 /ORGANISM="Strombidium rassoulzadegani, Strain ras09" /LENGTH=111 /DNA_ID=CAMNT_0008653521 /DNA_START=88 /DNA_END=423 /DNA_ORIENTATION=+